MNSFSTFSKMIHIYIYSFYIYIVYIYMAIYKLINILPTNADLGGYIHVIKFTYLLVNGSLKDIYVINDDVILLKTVGNLNWIWARVVHYLPWRTINGVIMDNLPYKQRQHFIREIRQCLMSQQIDWENTFNANLSKLKLVSYKWS